MNSGDMPYKRLGELLMELRQKRHKSIEELSGAIELDVETVKRYEKGEIRPPEDILSLIADHLDTKDEEYEMLYTAGGYNPKKTDDIHQAGGLPVMMLAGLQLADQRIVYTDNATVTVNEYGVIMQFMQTNGQAQPLAIAKVGMSIEHAKSIAKVLNETILQAEQMNKPSAPKQLSSGQDQPDNAR